jgi:hypothetical protein
MDTVVAGRATEGKPKLPHKMRQLLCLGHYSLRTAAGSSDSALADRRSLDSGGSRLQSTHRPFSGWRVIYPECHAGRDVVLACLLSVRSQSVW